MSCCCLSILRPPPYIDAVGLDAESGKCVWLGGHWWPGNSHVWGFGDTAHIYVTPGGSNATLTKGALHAVDAAGNSVGFEVVPRAALYPALVVSSGSMPLLVQSGGSNVAFVRLAVVSGSDVGGIARIENGSITHTDVFSTGSYGSGSLFSSIACDDNVAYSLYAESGTYKLLTHPGLNVVLTGSYTGFPFSETTFSATSNHFLLFNKVYDKTWNPVSTLALPSGATPTIAKLCGNYAIAAHNASGSYSVRSYSTSTGTQNSILIPGAYSVDHIAVSDDEAYVAVIYRTTNVYNTARLALFDASLTQIFNVVIDASMAQPFLKAQGKMFVKDGVIFTSSGSGGVGIFMQKWGFDGLRKWVTEIHTFQPNSFAYWEERNQIVYGQYYTTYASLPSSLKIFG